MFNLWLPFTIVFFSLVLLDLLWLSSLVPLFYRPHLNHLLSEKTHWIPAFLFYLLYTIGMLVFVLEPGLSENQTLRYIFFKSAFLGMLSYGTYNLTNQATLKKWPWIITLVDISWGALLTGTICWVSTVLTRGLSG